MDFESSNMASITISSVSFISGSLMGSELALVMRRGFD
jgi:hypothetical protein